MSSAKTKPKGTCDQRNRGRARTQERQTAVLGGKAEKIKIAQWFKGKYSESCDPADVDIDTFLYETESFNIDAHERLRLLAITLEENCVDAKWHHIYRIYQAALARNPDDRKLLYSIAVSAINSAINNQKLLRIANEIINDVLLIDSKDADFLYLRGSIVYDEGSPLEAMRWFDKCLEVDTCHHWAQLYKAHCLHDREQWAEAADTYHKVNPNAFSGHCYWRYEHLLEQRAHCLFHAGKIEECKKQLLSLLTRWENDPSLLVHVWGEEYIQFARSEFRNELYERTCEVFKNKNMKNNNWGCSYEGLAGHKHGALME